MATASFDFSVMDLDLDCDQEVEEAVGAWMDDSLLDYLKDNWKDLVKVPISLQHFEQLMKEQEYQREKLRQYSSDIDYCHDAIEQLEARIVGLKRSLEEAERKITNDASCIRQLRQEIEKPWWKKLFMLK